MPKPIVVLASGGNLGPGFARDLFLRWAPNPQNLVIFTDRGSSNSLARSLITNPRSPANRVLDLVVGARVPLDGDELVENP